MGADEPPSVNLDERTFRRYARYMAGERGLKQNTVRTYYRYVCS